MTVGKFLNNIKSTMDNCNSVDIPLKINGVEIKDAYLVLNIYGTTDIEANLITLNKDKNE